MSIIKSDGYDRVRQRKVGFLMKNKAGALSKCGLLDVLRSYLMLKPQMQGSVDAESINAEGVTVRVM